jgi:WD40-like Beta Propeller Repeat
MLRSRTRTLMVALSATIITACAPDVTDVELVLARSPSQSAAKYAAWSAPVWLGPIVNSNQAELAPRLTNDELSLYFGSRRAGGLGNNDVWVSRRHCLDCPFTVPVNLGPNINSPGNDGTPMVSRDGHWLFYASTKAGNEDIFVSHRDDPNDDLAWGPSVSLCSEINSSGAEGGPDYIPAGEAGDKNFHFTRVVGASVNIYVASINLATGKCGVPELVTGLGTPAREPSVRWDGKEMYFWSLRPGSMLADLFVTHRQSASKDWEPPQNVGVPVNHAGADLTPGLSFSGRTLVFASGLTRGGAGLQDIWMSTRTPSGK